MMTMDRPTSADLERMTTTDLPLAGYTVFWRLNKTRIPVDQFKALLDGEQLGHYLPTQPSAAKTLSRATEIWMERKLGVKLKGKREISGDWGISKSWEVVPVTKASSPWHIFHISSKNMDWASLGLSFATQMRVCLHKQSGVMIVTMKDAGEPDASMMDVGLTNELRVIWDQQKDIYWSEDLSTCIVHLVQSAGAVQVRDSGGVYFVGPTGNNRLESTRRILHALPGGNCYLVKLGVPDTEEAKSEMYRAVYQGLLDEVAQCTRKLDHTQRTPDQSVKSETISTRLMEYQDLRAKAEAMSDLLKFQREDLLKSIDELNERALAMMTTRKTHT